jgi:Radical SAM superfamily
MISDVVIVNLPRMLGHYLPAAPAILKGACNFLGVSSRVFDFNLDFLEACKHHHVDPVADLVGITEDCIPNGNAFSLTEELVERWAKKILAASPQIVAISVFSFHSQYFAKRLIGEIKRQSGVAIVLGGAGIKSLLNDAPHFALQLQQQGLVEHFIVDDGEIAFPNWLAGRLSIDKSIDSNSLDIPYMPDYSDYDIPAYLQSDQIWVPVTGSRGCVRKCDFCEVHQHWRFKQRSAEHIAKELEVILSLVESPHIHFTDSLVNGSLSEFNSLLDYLIELQSRYSFTWGGQFIIRSQATFGEQQWAKVGQSGARNLEIGIETGSDSLRASMNKQFTNLDLDYSMSMMLKYHVTCVFLMFVGHPKETESDYKDTLAMLEKYKEYNKKVIKVVQLGYSMAVMPGTPIYTNKQDYGLVTTKNPTIWISKHNPTLTFKQRLERRANISEFAKNLGYKLNYDDASAIQDMHRQLDEYSTQLKIIEKQII